ncbi:MAG: ethylbenzene dehydrogenase [Chloroflexi bacterium]|nr:ethylbenzene dehydrogenase [Chloroflexota bacterium]
MIRRVSILINLLVASAFLLAACGAQPAAPAQEPAAPTAEQEATAPPAEEPTAEPAPEEPAWEAPKGTLGAVPVTEAPTLDGVADEEFWAYAPAVTVEVENGTNTRKTTVTLQAVYTEDSVYFLVTYADPTESYLRSPWEMQADGSWIQLKDPNDKGGDNNLWYEDKFAMIWPINNSIPDFETLGCFTACHEGDTPDAKPFGNKYTAAEGQLGDMWHWKSVRNLNQIHDQWLDWTRYSADSTGAGRHSDPAESGGYKDNKTEDGSLPAFMPAGDFPRDGSPGYILASEAVPFDPSLFQPGDRLPSIVISEFVGDGGDIAAGWAYVDGMWILEFGRKLVTGSDLDIAFDDLLATYYFGVAVFDNAQVRHSYQEGAVPFIFLPPQ